MIIIGGGITGSAAAISFVKLGYSVALIEKSGFEKFKAGESLSPECKKYFSVIDFDIDHSCSSEYYGTRSLWGSNEINEKSFIYNPYGNGIAIDRNGFELQLFHHAGNCGAKTFPAAKTKNIITHKDRCQVVVEQNGETRLLNSGLVIYATGRSGKTTPGTNQKCYQDKLVAITSIQDAEDTQDMNLYIESMPNGWFYTNLLPDKKRVYTYFTDYDLIDRSKTKASFLRDQILTTRWSSEYSSFGTDPNVHPYIADARTGISNFQSGSGWFEIGDAAYTIDPLSGQGILKNFKLIDFWVEFIDHFFSDYKRTGQLYACFNADHFEQHLYQKTWVYSRESRWVENPFWARRIKLN